MPARATALAPLATATANVAMAIEETITTPTPGLGHSTLGNFAAISITVAGFLGYSF